MFFLGIVISDIIEFTRKITNLDDFKYPTGYDENILKILDILDDFENREKLDNFLEEIRYKECSYISDENMFGVIIDEYFYKVGYDEIEKAKKELLEVLLDLDYEKEDIYLRHYQR